MADNGRKCEMLRCRRVGPTSQNRGLKFSADHGVETPTLPRSKWSAKSTPDFQPCRFEVTICDLNLRPRPDITAADRVDAEFGTIDPLFEVCGSSRILAGRPNPAIRGHPKTGQSD